MEENSLLTVVSHPNKLVKNRKRVIQKPELSSSDLSFSYNVIAFLPTLLKHDDLTSEIAEHSTSSAFAKTLGEHDYSSSPKAIQ